MYSSSLIGILGTGFNEVLLLLFLQVERESTAKLQQIATTVECLRYDVNSPDEAKWQAWAKEIERQYAPVSERD